MALASRFEMVTPALGEWLARRVLASDRSIEAFMLVDDTGKVLAHRRVKTAEDSDDSSLVVPLLGGGIIAYLRIARFGFPEQIYERVSQLFSFQGRGIAP